ncbi:MAG TPA: acetylornithine transaminase [Gemmatimonadaceae bacterium]|nr:acetylornithine transaminase [Gemmatimonadaceae bacterium]
MTAPAHDMILDGTAPPARPRVPQGAGPAVLSPVPPSETATTEAVPPPDPLLQTYKRPSMELVGGDGVFLVDSTGKRYLDLVSGIAVNALGYGDAGLVAAMHAAADGLVHVSNLYETAPARRLASFLVERSFADRVFFCNSGAEANEGAFKFARRWARTQGDSKFEILALRGAFHGRLFATLAATDRPAYRMPFRPLAAGISVIERDLADLDAALDVETVAALIVEPVQGEGGVRVLDAGFLRELRALTRERSIALVFDEIQCGLGRTGSLFAYEQLGIEPDMLTLAKPLAGGLPMGAVLMTEAIAEAIRPGDHGTTFGGGPFVASVALHVLERIADPALLARVREHGTWLGDELRALAERTGRIRAVRGIGLMWGFDVMGSAAHVVESAREAGLLACTAGEHTVRLLPPLVITREELSLGIRILEQVL